MAAVAHFLERYITSICNGHGVVLTFLIEFPSAWELELAHESSKMERDDDESDSEDDTDENTKKEMISASGPLPGPSLAYQEFLQFLELGCSGSPLQGYPTVVIILSTISSTVRFSFLNP